MRLGAHPTILHARLGSGATLSTLALLAATGGLVACEEEEQRFEAVATYDPPTVLDFGATNVAGERRLSISVRAGGSRGLQVLDLAVSKPRNFIVQARPELMTGLTPGRTSTISVTYRPCPDAWNGNVRIPNFSLTACPGGLETDTLVITDNTTRQTVSITLTGEPVQPPQASYRCLQGTGACNMPTATRSECIGLNFGSLDPSSPDCDLYVEIVNSNRLDSMNREVRVAPLILESGLIEVRNITSSMSERIFNGVDAGFTLLNEDGTPFTPGLEIPVPDGQSSGSKLIRVRFNGDVTGNWFGGPIVGSSQSLGLRLSVNDPDRPLKTITVSGNASAPALAAQRLVDFGPVAQGRTVTATVTIRNEGDLVLNIRSLTVRPANAEFALRAVDGGMLTPRNVPPFGMQPFRLYVDYTPSDPASDRNFLDIASNNPTDPFTIELRGGPTPRACFPTIVEFPIEDPPTGMARRRNLVITSCGTGVLEVTGLTLQNSDNVESLDDFRVEGLDGCATLPCNPRITLCPQNNPECEINGQRPGFTREIAIVYENNDISREDRANLIVQTSDPGRGSELVVLDARDNPCVPPTIEVEVVTPRPCASAPVELRVTGDPGGPLGAPATLMSCDYNMLFGSTTTFIPDDTTMACAGTRFIPASFGLHSVEVTVVNSCGRSATSGSENINVERTCN